MPPVDRFFLFLEDQIVHFVSQLTREILEEAIGVVGLGRILARGWFSDGILESHGRL